jgi:demethylmenaquinone methyltransferase / 2-methoxy-6-polyprenyl-1,4-benzoquinol methylase
MQENHNIDNAKLNNDEQTHFGFSTINISEKQKKVSEVFSSVASQYDIMNDLMSIGMHRIWKKIAVSHAQVKVGYKVLDIASGTGDLAASFAKLASNDKKKGEVWATDINEDMLLEGKKRLLDQGLILNYAVCNAEQLPFAQNYFDVVSVSFGLRNMTNKHIALQQMHKVLKPGGRLIVLEFSHIHKKLQAAYDWYSFNILPKLGQLIVNDADSYKYLAESIRMHPNQEELKTMMHDAGFTKIEYHNMSVGIVALHIGIKY